MGYCCNIKSYSNQNKLSLVATVTWTQFNVFKNALFHDFLFMFRCTSIAAFFSMEKTYTYNQSIDAVDVVAIKVEQT